MTTEATRHYLPATRSSITHHVEIQGEQGEIDLYLTAGYYPDTREIGELFLQVGKQGSTLKGLLDGWAVMISFALQYGNDIDAIIAKFKDSAFQPAGRTTNPEIPACTSLLDYVVCWIELNRRIPNDENPINRIQFPANVGKIPGVTLNE